MSAEKIGQPSRLDAPIAFKKELEALREQRRVPVERPALTIGGGIEYSVHAAEDRRREVRIGTMETRLHEAREVVEAAYALAQRKSRARRDFERSR